MAEKWYCYHCKSAFDEPTYPKFRQVHGYSSAGDKYAEDCYEMRCPNCDREIENEMIEVCDLCDEPCETEHCCVCDNCIEEHATFEYATAAGATDRETFRVNGFFASILSERQIDEILKEYILKNVDDLEGYIKSYVYCDKSWFAEFISEYE